MTDYDPGAPTRLDPGILIDALAATLAHEPIAPGEVVTGRPTTGVQVLDERDGREIGIWEMTPGTATDVEVDEVCVILRGRATVVIDEMPRPAGGEAPEPPPAAELGPGSVMRFVAGMHTTWTVHETLRKIYIS